MAELLLRAGHLAAEQQADPQPGPAPGGDQPRDGQRGRKRRLARYRLRAGLAPCQTQGSGQILVGGVGDVDLAGNVENTLNWEPRLGVTYQINDKTVVRAGYGRSHDIGTFGSTFGHAVTQNLPVLSIQEINAPANYAAVFNLAQGPPPATFITSPTGRFQQPDGVNSFVRTAEMRLLRTDNWNVTVQRQLSTYTSVSWATWGTTGATTWPRTTPTKTSTSRRSWAIRTSAQRAQAVLQPLRLDAGFPGTHERRDQRLQLAPDQVHQEHEQAAGRCSRTTPSRRQSRTATTTSGSTAS